MSNRKDLQSNVVSHVDGVLPVVTMSLNIASVKRYFSEDNPSARLDIRDVLVYVRRMHPNPRQRVVLQSDVPLAVNDLAEALIYVEGTNELEANKLHGLGERVYCPFEITKAHMKEEGFGIQPYVESFCREGNIRSCELLIYGDDIDDLIEVWNYLQEVGVMDYTVSFPHAVSERLKLFGNGLDLAPYAQELETAYGNNTLSVSFIKSVLARVGQRIEEGKRRLQDFESTRSIYAKWLTLVLTQKYNLVPVYVGSFFSEYLGLKVAYPLDKLSMYERFKFVDDLPENLGYIGKYHGFQCLFQVMKKIYPVPAMAFDIQEQTVITEGLDEFKYEDLKIADWRTWFKESPTFWVSTEKAKNTKALQVMGGDREVDARLREIFLQMTAASDDKIFMSVGNSVLAQFRGKTYVPYYNQMLGIAGFAISEQFGREALVIPEDNFCQLIDARIVAAVNKASEASTLTERDNTFASLMVQLPRTFRTALPLDVLMCCKLVGQSAKELSYYDRRLRCDTNALPIITHEDAAGQREKTVFDFLDINMVGRDPIAGPIISSFGSINSDSGYLDSIPVSMYSFKGWKLL